MMGLKPDTSTNHKRVQRRRSRRQEKHQLSAIVSTVLLEREQGNEPIDSIDIELENLLFFSQEMTDELEAQQADAAFVNALELYGQAEDFGMFDTFDEGSAADYYDHDYLDRLDSFDDGFYTVAEDDLWAAHQAGKDKEPKEEEKDDYIIMRSPANPFGAHQPIPEECRAVL